jgi:hypothetical protein
MKRIIGLILVLSLAACSTCKSTDSPDVCRTKQRDHGQPHAALPLNGSIHVDENGTVTTATTVNASVHLGDHASATSLDSVNGSIALGAGAHVSGSAAPSPAQRPYRLPETLRRPDLRSTIA